MLFDAVGTLIHPTPNVATAYASVGRRLGSRLTEDEIRSRFQAAFTRQEQLDRETLDHATSETRERQRWQAIVAETLVDVTDHGAAFAQLWEHFARPEHWRLDDDAPTLLGALQDQGCILGVASNFDARLTTICRALVPQFDPDRVFASSLVGWKKPSPRFFEAVAARLDATPEQLMLVGDDLENDYRAASAAGWQAVLVDRHGPSAERRSVTRLAEVALLVAPPT